MKERSSTNRFGGGNRQARPVRRIASRGGSRGFGTETGARGKIANPLGPLRPVESVRSKAGMIVTLPVERETEFGYFLHDGYIDILLHQKEMTEPVKLGDEVQVFLYHDHDKRLAATMQMPLVHEGTYDWLEVVNVSTKMGVFLYNGIQRDLLLFIDDLPKMRDEWPKRGDRLYVTIKRDKFARIVAKPATEEVFRELVENAGPEMQNRWVEGRVYRVIEEGAFLLTNHRHIMFIHRDEMTGRLRMGQELKARVTFVRDDGRLNGSMKARKEVQYSEDAERLLSYLAERGAMPYTDETAPEVIKDKFDMSKSAFKRAIGKLLKDGLIEQEEGWTHLKRDVFLKMQQEQAGL